MSVRIKKNLVVGDTTLVSQSAWNAELEAKHERLVEWMRARRIGGVLLRRNENLAWLTGGAVEVRVLTPCETGVASLLVTADGRRYYFTTENEAPRLHEEEFGALDFEPVIAPWWADNTVEEATKLAGGSLACDVHANGAVVANFYPLRMALSESEIARLRWLGAETATAVTEAIHKIEQGMSEYDMEAVTTDGILRRGIQTSVYLYAVDDRILKYKHAVAHGARLKQYGMLNLCTRKWGLTVSITRFLHFGKLPEELASRFLSSARVNATLQHATREGATAADLFRIVQGAYCAEGFPGEERLHHQGGATGYGEREWIATPAGKEVVVNNQAYAWNPSIRGGKAEDTVILIDGKIENITATPSLPTIDVTLEGNIYTTAGVLEK